MSIYVDLTRQFNEGRLRAVLSSGQAVVLHRLAVMSKDGDWIVRETPEALEHVRAVLDLHGSRYRLGAPLDVRWMAGGWSSHLEFRHQSPSGPMRVRTDFVSRPPRLSPEDLAALWEEQRGAELPFVDARRLVELKKTDREKDYAVIGELARTLESLRDRLLCSRSARDLVTLGTEHTDLARSLASLRPLLGLVGPCEAELERALDAERRGLIHANEARLQRYRAAAAAWESAWPSVDREIEGLPLPDAHRIVVARATGVLPFRLPESGA